MATIEKNRGLMTLVNVFTVISSPSWLTCSFMQGKRPCGICPDLYPPASIAA